MSNNIFSGTLDSFLPGRLTGLRTFTPLTVLAWTLHLHRMSVLGSSLHFLHTLTACVILTMFAIGELVADKFPKTPSRLKPPGMVGRIIFGFMCGAIAGQAWGTNWEMTAGVGLVAAIVGALIGYEVRKGWVRTLHTPDFLVALIEDAVAIGGSILVVSRAIYLSF